MKITTLAMVLNNNGITIDDAQIMNRILFTLPSLRFANLKESWASVTKADRTVDNFLARVKCA